MKKNKVALVHNIIAPYRIPIFEGLAASPDIDLTVYFCSETHSYRKWEVLKDVNYNYEILPGFLFQLRDITVNINIPIIKKLRSGNFDIVIIGGCVDFTSQMAYFFSKIHHKPVILWSEGIEPSSSLVGKLIQPIINHIVRGCTAIIVPGTMSRDYHKGITNEENNIFIAPNSIDNEKYLNEIMRLNPKRDMIKEKLGYKDVKIILSLSQIIERKGIIYLIQAFELIRRENPDVILLIVGAGEQKDDLIKYCLEKNLSNVFFPGWVDEYEKIVYYSISDLFVLPTLSDVWGLSINEAMVTGLPVITTTKAGCSKDLIVPGLNGYIVTPKDVNGLFNAINTVLLDNHDNNLGIKSQQIIQEHFCVEKMIKGFIDAINYCLTE
jgi:glycosyltransferase involved in cell wall biosynthesis